MPFEISNLETTIQMKLKEIYIHFEKTTTTTTKYMFCPYFFAFSVACLFESFDSSVCAHCIHQILHDNY